MKGVVDGAYIVSAASVRVPAYACMDIARRKYDNLKIPMAGKTGTTTDGWFMGLTPELVTGVWVGAQDPSVRFSTTSLGQGANTGLPIFGFFMNKVVDDKSYGFRNWI